ncbi:MAG: class I SAM-dependent methyltransferase [Thermoplasmatota archaeon]
MFTQRYATLTGPRGVALGVDLLPEALEVARAQAGAAGNRSLKFQIFDLEKDPPPLASTPDGRWDIVFATNVLHHVHDLSAAATRLFEASRSILVADFDPAGPGEVGPDPPQRLAPGEVTKALRMAGFQTNAPRVCAFEEYVIIASRP